MRECEAERGGGEGGGGRDSERKTEKSVSGKARLDGRPVDFGTDWNVKVECYWL